MKKKFKIWDKKHKRWFHGHNDPSRPASTQAISLFGETILFGNMMVDQNTDKEISLDRLNDLVAIQYTGLKDKNDKEIYEGDILKAISPWDSWGDENIHVMIGPVIFDEYRFRMKGYSNGMTYSDYNDDVHFSHAEVIGNIYENPELLENNQ